MSKTLKTAALSVALAMSVAGSAYAQATVPYPTANGEQQIPAAIAGEYVHNGVLGAAQSADVAYGVGRERASATGGQAGGNPNEN